MSTDRADIKLLVVPGSLRSSSFSVLLAHRAAALAPAGVDATVYDALRAVAPFDEDDELNPPAGVIAWREALRDADAVLFVTPEYNSSIPGQLKNALDWASRVDNQVDGTLSGNALYGKHTAVISTSTGQFGGVWAAAELIKVLKALGARVVENGQYSLGSAADAFDEVGSLKSSGKHEKLAAFVADLVATIQTVATV